MLFISSSLTRLSSTQEHTLHEMNINIVHKAKLLPIYILKGDSKKEVERTNFFTDVRESSIFSLADVTFNPHLSNKPLKKKAIVGWGNTKVAIIDSGVLPGQLSLVYEKDFTGYSNQIVNNHGTHVAKIVNYYSPGSQLLSLKVAHQGNDIQEGHIFMALDEAIDQGADIINLSIGSTRHCDGTCPLCTYIDAVVDTGVIVVSAAGNNGRRNGNTIDCPGAAGKSVTVGAIDYKRKIADFSGKGIPGMLKPNIVAPGYVTVKVKYGNVLEMENNSGTSFATPLVTGILASLYSVLPDRHKIITMMYNTCQQINEVPRHHQGFGIVNLSRLVEVCENDIAISNSRSRQKPN